MVGHRCVVAAFVEGEKMGVCMSVAPALGLGTFEVERGICSEPVVVIFRVEMADTFSFGSEAPFVLGAMSILRYCAPID